MGIMETPTTDELTGEDVSEDTAEVDSAGPLASTPLDNEEFKRRVDHLVELMKTDPAVERRLLAEMYVNMSSAEMGIRGVFEAIQSQGISGLMRGAFKRGK